MNAHFFSAAEKKQLLAELEEQFGIQDMPYLFLETGKEKVRAFSGSLSKDEILDLAKVANIEIIGLYIARKEHDLRLSFDATQLLKLQISKNIIDLSKEQAREWLRGNDLEIVAPKGTAVMRCGADMLGCGKSTGERIANHVPKERRIKK